MWLQGEGSGIPWRHRSDRWRIVLFGIVLIASLVVSALLSWFVFDFLLVGFRRWLERNHPFLSGLLGLCLVGFSWWVATTFWHGLEPQLDRRRERREQRRKLPLEHVLYPRVNRPKIKPKAPDRLN